MALDVLKLLENHGHELHALLMRLTLRPDVADDLFQELFIRLRTMTLHRDVDHPPAFARRVAIHLAFDWRRSLARQQRLLAAASREQPLADPPWLGIAQQEEADRILAVAADLSPLIQQAFVLRHVSGQSYEAIGAAIQRTPHQARALCHAAIREIRRAMEQRGWMKHEPSQKAGVT